MSVFKGCYTANITPMKKNREIDYEGLKKLIDYQSDNGVSGVLACGTTGESSTLPWKDHDRVIQGVHECLDNRGTTIAGTGSNSTEEMMRASKEMYDFGIRCVLLVDPYYNGPSSLEIRREYVTPVAEKFPEMQVIPYIIPGRTGTQLLPQDLAILHASFKNVRAVKEATGDLENIKQTRRCCGEDFDILSGDDDKTFDMMVSSEILASGVISVASNVFPRVIQEMTKLILENKVSEGKEVYEKIKPMFELVTIKTYEETAYGPVLCKARNPLGYKTLMNVLGMPSGPCRPPLGKMTKNGFKILLDKTRKVFKNNPEFFEPIERFFNVDVEKRLHNKKHWVDLTYD